MSDEDNGNLPKSFRNYCDVRTIETNADNLKSNLEDNGYHGLITALDDNKNNELSGPMVESQVNLPVVDLNSLKNPNEKRRFVNRIYGHFRWRKFKSGASELSDLIDFHSREKLSLLAHDPSTKEKLGHMLANPPDMPFDRLMRQYRSQFDNAIRKLTTRERHFNVFEHLYGYLAELLPDEKRNDLLAMIRNFRTGEGPLIEPLKELKKEFEGRSIEWVSNQSYLNPRREEIALKSDIGSDLYNNGSK